MALAFNPTAFADGHGNEATSDGAFTTLMVQAEDVGAYIKALEASDNVFEATGTIAVGYCLTRSGTLSRPDVCMERNTSLSSALSHPKNMTLWKHQIRLYKLEK